MDEETTTTEDELTEAAPEMEAAEVVVTEDQTNETDNGIEEEIEPETAAEANDGEDEETQVLNAPMFDPNDPKQWYILSTYSGHEKKVAEQIKQRINATGLDDQITEVLVPTQEKTIAKEGKKRTKEERIFPGYVLVKMEMNDDTWHLLRNTEGVTGFVGTSKKPTPMSEQEVKAIMAFTKVKQNSYQTAYSINDSVRVIDGPFKDFVGIVQEINESKGQLTVLLSIFGRETPVTLDFLQVTNL